MLEIVVREIRPRESWPLKTRINTYSIGGNMRTKELLRILRSSGAQLTRHGKEHDRYHCPKTDKTVSVLRHARKLAIGTV